MGILDGLRLGAGGSRLKWHRLEPAPLIDWNRGYCLFFSNKAGCTTLAKWFFHQTGQLDKALEHHRWIHRYRIEVYCRTDGYREALRKLADGNLHIVKLVRSPYSRAVSSYLHAINTVYADHAMSRFLGRAVNPVSRFSFEEFVGYLESTGVTRCDLHHRRQCTDAELSGALRIRRLLRLETLEEDLRLMERELALQPTDLGMLSESSHHNDRGERKHLYCGGTVFSRDESRFPPYPDFYDQSLCQKVHRLYRDDFRQYGYATSLE